MHSHDRDDNDGTGTNIKRALAPAFGILAALIAFGASLIAAPAVISGDRDHDYGGAVTDKTPIATGMTERFGSYTLLTSQTADGGLCVDIQVSEFEAGVNDPSDPVTVGGCGGPPHTNVITRDDATLFFGRVPDSAEAVRVQHDGKEKKVKKASKAKDGRRYVVIEVAGEKLKGAQVTALDGEGRSLGRIDPAGLAAAEGS